MRFLPAVLLVVWLAVSAANTPEVKTLLNEVSAAYVKLEPQTIRPAEGYIRYDYLVPGGYYKEMWDWDGFFIGSHLAHQSRDQAKYLKGWVLSFAGAIDKEGYVAGLITTKGPIPLNGGFGKFAMKPFLAQGAVIASERLADYQWVAPIWDNLRGLSSTARTRNTTRNGNCSFGRTPCSQARITISRSPTIPRIPVRFWQLIFAPSSCANMKPWPGWPKCLRREMRLLSTDKKLLSFALPC